MRDKNKTIKTAVTAVAVLAALAAVIAVILHFTLSGRENVQETSAVTKPTEPVTQFVSDELKAKYEYNNDVVGWITVPGTDIDNELLQSDDNDFYLRKTIDREYSIWGCYFVDYKCNMKSREDLSRVTIIYGHSLKDYKDGKKFTQLKRYNDLDFCRGNQIITVSTLYDKMKFKIFAVSTLPITFNYIEAEPDDALFGEVLAKLYENRIQFFPDIQVGKDDKILLLQTCTSDKNRRFIIAAKLMDE